MSYVEKKANLLLEKVLSKVCIKSDKIFLEEFKKKSIHY